MEVVGMTHFRRLLVAVLGAVSLVGAASASVGAHEGGTLVEFDSMTGVSAAVAAAQVPNDRGIKPGGAPWVITSGSGEVDRQGNIHVDVVGLIIPTRTPPSNPVGSFRATLSCLTPHGVVNVTTGPAATGPAGNATIDATVALPHPCKHPEVFVGTINTAGAFVWFAMSNAEEEDEN
jgi:hypothetical protein